MYSKRISAKVKALYNLHMLTPGTPAPDFSLQDQNGTLHTLSEYKGKNILVYFYPKDDTPGCTKEACTLRDGYSEYEKRNIIVLGINANSVESHKTFVEKYHLPFTLLSDPSKETCRAYEAKGMFFTARISYLIDEEGIILKAFPNVDPATHSQLVLEAIDFTNGGGKAC